MAIEGPELVYGIEKRKNNNLIKSGVRFDDFDDAAHRESLDKKKHQKSKSVLSRYLSSKLDKHSLDFDDILPKN